MKLKVDDPDKEYDKAKKKSRRSYSSYVEIQYINTVTAQKETGGFECSKDGHLSRKNAAKVYRLAKELDEESGVNPDDTGGAGAQEARHKDRSKGGRERGEIPQDARRRLAERRR